MRARTNHFAIYMAIVVSLFLALVPVILSNNYLRQDDLKTGIWWGMRIKDEGYLYYNTTMQLVRPICMFIFYIIDLLSINMHYAVIVRFASIVNVCVLAILLYRWQLLFNANRLLAATFAIAAFTLPGIQLAAATANYFLMIFGVLLAFGGPYYWYQSYISSDLKRKRKYLILGHLLFFASFLDYPISSMFAWVMISICYLNSLISNAEDGVRLKRFAFYAAFLTLALTGFYFVFMHLFHWFFQVNLSYGRVGTTHISEILSRMIWIFDILQWHSLLWVYYPGQWLYYYPMIAILALFALALTIVNFKRADASHGSIMRVYLVVPFVLFFAFLMCYSPAFATQENAISYTFRYTLATMPLLLYVAFWSISVITSFFAKARKLAHVFFVSVAMFGVYYANTRIGDGIVGPQDNDFRYIEAQLSEKVIPLLRQNKLVALYVRDCDHGSNYHFEKDVPFALEYAMRICAYPNHLIGAINHSLMTLGYTSNRRRANQAVNDGKIIVLQDIPWGNLIIGSDDKYDMRLLDYPKKDMTLVTIDMRKAPPYKHMDFYKRLWSMVRSF